MKKPRLLIFDLGNVVYHFSFENAIRYWAGKSGIAEARIRGLYILDRMYEKHETDEISIERYKDHVCEALGMELSLAEFIVGWNSIFMDKIEGIDGILEGLRTEYTVAALSNTNSTHLKKMKEKYAEVFKSFDRLYFSNEIKARKPEERAFRIVLADYGLEAKDAVFFDDLQENVEGARRIGMAGVEVGGIESIRAWLDMQPHASLGHIHQGPVGES